jgi:hypothetical protein
MMNNQHFGTKLFSLARQNYQCIIDIILQVNEPIFVPGISPFFLKKIQVNTYKCTLGAAKYFLFSCLFNRTGWPRISKRQTLIGLAQLITVSICFKRHAHAVLYPYLGSLVRLLQCSAKLGSWLPLLCILPFLYFQLSCFSICSFRFRLKYPFFFGLKFPVRQ